MSTKIRTQDIQDAAITGSKLSIPSTKGDLLGFDTAPNRLPVGVDGNVLTADSSQALGVKWSSPSGGMSSSNFADNETPSGAVNGSNAAFSLANTPAAGSVHLYKNGLRQVPTSDYTIAGSSITFVAGNVPQTGDVLLADYRK